MNTKEELEKIIKDSNHFEELSKDDKLFKIYNRNQALNRQWVDESREYHRLKDKLGDKFPYKTIGGFKRARRSGTLEYQNIKKLARDLTKEKNNGNIKLPNETIPKSLGAKWTNKDILMPDGSITHFVEGTKLTNQEVFAGKGTKKSIRDVERLVKENAGTKPEDWQKVKGIGVIFDIDGSEVKAELHWYQCEKVGKIEFKVKKL